MCGVIKSAGPTDGQTAAQFHGNARLGPTGAATVFLPRHFREASSWVVVGKGFAHRVKTMREWRWRGR